MVKEITNYSRNLYRAALRKMAEAGGYGLTGRNPALVEQYRDFGFENITDVRNLNTYKESLYLYIAVSKIAKRAAGVEWDLYRIVNSQGETEDVADHPLIDLMAVPNSFQTRREFMEMSVAHYCLAGDVFWYLYRDGQRIVGMVPLMPDRMEILLNQDRDDIIGYEYRNTEYLKLAPEDVVHIKNPDPTNILRGVGAVRPATTRILTEQEAAQHQRAAFKNMGRPDLAVFYDRPITQEDSDEARERWRKTFGGDNTGNVGFFGNDAKDVKEISQSPKELGYIESQKFLRDDILAALGVPKAMVTSDDVNFSNAKEAYRMFLQEAVVPVVTAFVDAANHRLAPKLDETVFFHFEDPTPGDRDMRLKETTQLKKEGIITANEAREKYGYDSLEGGDTLTQNQNNARIEVQNQARRILKGRKVLYRRFKAKEALSDALGQANGPTREMNSIFPTKEAKAAYAKAVNDRIDRVSDRLKDAIDEFHKGQEQRVLENMGSALSPEGFMDQSEERRRAKDELGPVVKDIYREGGQRALDAVFRKDADTFFADEVLLAAVAERVEFFASSMTETTFNQLSGVIVSGIQAGKGVEDVKRDIKREFADIAEKRARTIAQTETNYAMSKATNDAYQQSSVVTGKEWISVGDEKVRPEHQENNGTIVAKGGVFPNGEEWPGQNSPNCRCVLAPAV